MNGPNGPRMGPHGPRMGPHGPAWARMGPHGPAWARMGKMRRWYWNCPCLLKKRARSHTRAATAARDLLLLQHPPALDALAPPLLPHQLLGLAPLLLPMLPIGCWRTLTTLVRQWVQPLFHGLHVSDRGPSRRTNRYSLGRSSRADGHFGRFMWPGCILICSAHAAQCLGTSTYIFCVRLAVPCKQKKTSKRKKQPGFAV